MKKSDENDGGKETGEAKRREEKGKTRVPRFVILQFKQCPKKVSNFGYFNT